MCVCTHDSTISGELGSSTEDSSFEVPEANVATVPPEWRGNDRDDVRLLVSSRRRRRVTHRRFHELPDLLSTGDLLVVNRSRTVPAAVPVRRHGGRRGIVHVANSLGGDLWVVELREPSGWGTTSTFDARPGEHLAIGDRVMTLLAPYRHGDRPDAPNRLWLAKWAPEGEPLEQLRRLGGPIRYDYVEADVPLEHYQTVFADEPGSAEMPSAGRAFTDELLGALRGRGVELAKLTLHTGVSSFEAGEGPFPERFRVPADTIEAVRTTRARGGRVVAVGTTVVRALESCVDATGRLSPHSGWTDLVVRPGDELSTVDALLTGLHTPESSHLAMLTTLIDRSRLLATYREAVRRGYLWHEFGDVHLIS